MQLRLPSRHTMPTRITSIVVSLLSMLALGASITAVALACEGGEKEECFGGIGFEGNTKFNVKESHIITIHNKNCVESEKVETGNLSGGGASFKVNAGEGCYKKMLYAASLHCGVTIECIKTGSETFEVQPQEEALKTYALKC